MTSEMTSRIVGEFLFLAMLCTVIRKRVFVWCFFFYFSPQISPIFANIFIRCFWRSRSGWARPNKDHFGRAFDFYSQLWQPALSTVTETLWLHNTVARSALFFIVQGNKKIVWSSHLRTGRPLVARHGPLAHTQTSRRHLFRVAKQENWKFLCILNIRTYL